MSSGPTNAENPGSSKQQSMVRIHTAESTRVPGQWSSNQGKSILSGRLKCDPRKGNWFKFQYHVDELATEASSRTLHDRLSSATALVNLRNLGSNVRLRTR